VAEFFKEVVCRRVMGEMRWVHEDGMADLHWWPLPPLKPPANPPRSRSNTSSGNAKTMFAMYHHTMCIRKEAIMHPRDALSYSW